MNRDDIERLWFQAMRESTEANEPYIRHRFANLVAAAEREACAQIVNEMYDKRVPARVYANTIRARGDDA